MTAAAIWHDVECGHYTEDLALWRTLADACGGPVLDIGAGTGRVSLDLAARGFEVTALDNDAGLLDALSGRAEQAGLDVSTVCGDARDFELDARFSLIIVPMQTIQLLGGSSGRRRFLRAARSHLAPRGLLAMAVADALGAFDGDADGLPSPDQETVGGVLYSSQTMALTDEGERAVIHRLRSIDGSRDAEHHTIALDHLQAEDLQTEALMLGYTRRPMRQIPGTDDYVGSTVVIAGA